MTIEKKDALHEEGQSFEKCTSFEDEYLESLHLKSEEGGCFDKCTSFEYEYLESFHNKPEKVGCLASIYPSGFLLNLKDVLKISLPLVSVFLHNYIYHCNYINSMYNYIYPKRYELGGAQQVWANINEHPRLGVYCPNSQSSPSSYLICLS